MIQALEDSQKDLNRKAIYRQFGVYSRDEAECSSNDCGKHDGTDDVDIKVTEEAVKWGYGSGNGVLNVDQFSRTWDISDAKPIGYNACLFVSGQDFIFQVLGVLVIEDTKLHSSAFRLGHDSCTHRDGYVVFELVMEVSRGRDEDLWIGAWSKAMAKGTIMGLYPI